jgi:hypothetical protein
LPGRIARGAIGGAAAGAISGAGEGEGLADTAKRAAIGAPIGAVTRLESIRAQDAMARFGIDELLGPGRMFRSDHPQP